MNKLTINQYNSSNIPHTYRTRDSLYTAAQSTGIHFQQHLHHLTITQCILNNRYKLASSAMSLHRAPRTWVERWLLEYLCRLWIIARWSECQSVRSCHVQLWSFISGLRAVYRLAFQSTSQPACQSTNLPANVPDVFNFGIPKTAHGSHPIQGSLGHAWNAVFLPIFAAYGSSSGGLNFGRYGPVTLKFFSFTDLEHFPGQPASLPACTLPVNLLDVFRIGIPNTAHGFTAYPGISEHEKAQ